MSEVDKYLDELEKNPAQAESAVNTNSSNPDYNVDDYLASLPAPDRGFTGALIDGAKSAGRAISSTYNTYTGDAQAVIDNAKTQELANEDKSQDIKNFQSDFAANTGVGTDDEVGLWGAIKGAGKAIIDNPRGAALSLAEQFPNSVPTLAGGWAGAKAGSIAGGTIGSAFAGVGAAPGAVIGGVTGFVGGMFLGNTLTETGYKAQEYAADGEFTPDEQSAAMTEGAKKAGVITAVDALTFGIGGKVSSTMRRTAESAVEAATRKTLIDAGVDISDTAALAAARSNPQIASQVVETQKNAARIADSLRKRAAEAGVLLTVETIGEGLGDYLGELAATGQASVSEAVLESFLSLGQSSVQSMFNFAKAREKSLTEQEWIDASNGIAPEGMAPEQMPVADGIWDKPTPEAKIDMGQMQDGGVTPLPVFNPQDIDRNLAPTPSQQMGINPDDGPLSAAAAQSVDSGLFVGGFTPQAGINQAALEREGVTPPPVLDAGQLERGLGERPRSTAFDDPYTPATAINPVALDRQGVTPPPVLNTDQLDRNLAPTQQAALQQPVQQPAAQRTPEQDAQSIWDNLNTFERNAAATKVLGMRGVPAKNAATKAWDKLSPKQQAKLTAGLGAQQGQRWTDPNQKVTDQTGPVLQNRDRTSQDSINQMRSISNNPDYSRLKTSGFLSDGAPVVVDENIQIPASQMGVTDTASAGNERFNVQYAVVEADQLMTSNSIDGTTNAEYQTGAAGKARAIAGNGRITGLQSAWAKGNASQYKADMAADRMHGIDPAAIEGMRNPILVRLLPQDQVTDNIGDLSNRDEKGRLSPVEQAKTDMSRIDLDSLKFTADGAIGGEAIHQFRMAQPAAERVTEAEARKRLTSAIFQKAYGNDQLTEIQSGESDDAKSILSALAQAAPSMSRLEGAGEFDIRPLITQAGIAAVNSARRGTKLADYVQQSEMGIDPMVYPILEMMLNENGNIRSSKYIGEQLTNMAKLAYDEANSPSSDMFGEKPKRTAEQVIQDALTGVQGYGQINDRRGQESLGQRGRSEPDAQMVEGPEGGRERPADIRQTAPTQPEAEQEQPAAVAPWGDRSFTLYVDEEYGPPPPHTKAYEAAKSAPKGSVTHGLTVRPSGKQWHNLYLSHGNGDFSSVSVGKDMPSNTAELIEQGFSDYDNKQKKQANALEEKNAISAKEIAIAKENNLALGRELGVIIPNTGKQFKSAKIVADHGDGTFTLRGVQGNKQAELRGLSASSIVRAMDRQNLQSGAKSEGSTPETWRSNYLRAAKVARDLGIDPKQHKKLADLVAAIDAFNAEPVASQPKQQVAAAKPAADSKTGVLIDNATDMTSALAAIARGAQLSTEPNGDVILSGTKIITLPKQPTSVDEVIGALAVALRDQMRADGVSMPGNPAEMTRDQFVVAYEFANIIPEFEITGEDIGGVVQGSNSGLTVDADKLYDKIVEQTKGQSKSKTKEDPTKPNSSKVKLEASKTTMDEWVESEIENSKYADAYRDDPQARKGKVKQLEDQWRKAVVEAAKDGRIQTEVLDDFVSREGETGLLRTFRGEYEAGIKGYDLPSVRSWDKTYAQYMAQMTAADKMMGKGSHKSDHARIVRDAIARGEPVPDNVRKQVEGQQEAQAPDLDLTQQTEETLAADAERLEQLQKEEAAQKAKQKAAESKARERDADKARADEVLDDFQLGQQAEDAMSGMDDIFATESKPKVEPTKTPLQSLNEAIDSIIEEQRAIAEDWKNREYKDAKGSVQFEGDGPSTKGSMSINAINEGRRRKAIEQASNSIAAAKKLKDSASEGSGEKLLNQMALIYNKPIAGNDSPTTAEKDAMFEARFLRSIDFDGKQSGATQSNSISKAMLVAVKEHIKTKAIDKQKQVEAEAKAQKDFESDTRSAEELISDFFDDKADQNLDSNKTSEGNVARTSLSKEAEAYAAILRRNAESFDGVYKGASLKPVARDFAEHAIENGRRMTNDELQGLADKHNVPLDVIHQLSTQQFTYENLAYATELKDSSARALRREALEIKANKAAAQNKPSQAIEDFGEKMAGAIKDQPISSLSKNLTDEEMASQPLSALWPVNEPLSIEDNFAAAFSYAARQNIPAKPRLKYKVKRWVDAVKSMREIAKAVQDGEITKDNIGALSKTNDTASSLAAKANLLSGLDRKHWSRIGRVDVSDNAFIFDENRNKVPSPHTVIVVDGRSVLVKGKYDNDSVTAVIKASLEMAEQSDASKRGQFEIRQNRNTGEIFINRKGDKEYRKLKTFPKGSVKEARDFVNNNTDELVAEWEAIKERDNVTKADVRSDTNKERTGIDYRNGKDVTSEEFAETFGFRGVEFGNWVSQGKGQKDRQGMLNAAYDALLDLAAVVGIPPKAISLNGSLGIAFGSRGKGKYSAHYETNNIVINLTKTKGAGSLAHEWFHALDNYFSRRRGVTPFDGNQTAYNKANYITYKPEPMMALKTSLNKKGLRPHLITKAEYDRRAKSGVNFDADNWTPDTNHPIGVRPVVEKAFAELVSELDKSPMLKRSETIDKGKVDGYWSSIIERAARSFESYVIQRLEDQGISNQYLANVVTLENFKRDEGRYPYLTNEELKPVAEKFDTLFSTIETREEKDGNFLMFSRNNNQPNNPTTNASLLKNINDSYPALTDSVVTMLQRGRKGQKGGLVIVDSNNGADIAKAYSDATGLPIAQANRLFSDGESINGFYDTKSGITFLVGPNLDAATAPAVLLHEVTHSQQRSEIDARSMKLINGRAKEKNADLKTFLETVSQRMIDAGEYGNPLESTTYIVEQAIIEGRSQGYTLADSKFLNAIEKTLGSTVASIVRDFTKMVRQFALRRGLPINITLDDLVQYAMASVEQAAKGNIATENKGGMAYSFAGEDALTADLASLAEAKKQIATDLTPDQVRKNTGWMQGAEGRWRFEIDDSKASFVDAPMLDSYLAGTLTGEKKLNAADQKALNLLKLKERKMSAEVFGAKDNEAEAWDQLFYEWHQVKQQIQTLERRAGGEFMNVGSLLKHDQLLNAYPGMKNIKIRLAVDDSVTMNGFYDRKDNLIEMTAPNKEKLMDGLLHELQHAIQSIEGFARGGSPSQFDYKDATSEYLGRVSNKIIDLLNSNKEFGATVRKVKQEFTKLSNKYPLVTKDGQESVNWDKVPTDESEAYFKLLDETEKHPEVERWHDLETEYRIVRRDGKTLTPFEQYQSLAGEVEARNVESRRYFTEEERKEFSPIASEDFQRQDQTIRYSRNAKARVEGEQQFAQTEKAYGGRAAYDQAKSEGKTKLNYQQWVQVRTSAFKEWFGDWENDPDNASKVVDSETGEPLVVYHGTPSFGFNEFDVSLSGSRDAGDFGRGFYFSPSKDYASSFENHGAGVNQPGDGSKTYAVYLSMKNPLRVSTRNGVPDSIPEGHDGVLVYSDKYYELPFGHVKNLTEIVVFDSTQIKSATDNIGTFDPANPDIRYSRTGKELDAMERMAADIERNTGDVSPAEARRVQQAIEGRSLVDAARFLTQSSDKARAAVARKVLDKLEAMEKSGVNLELNVVHVGDSAPEAMASARAYTEMAMDSKGRDVVVWVNGADVAGKVGVEEEALLHELVHAATSGALLHGSKVEGSPHAEAAKAVYDAAGRISEHISNRFQQAAQGQVTLTPFEQDMRDGYNNAFRSMDEVVAWAMTNREAQQYLDGIPSGKNRTLWTRFVEAVRSYLGLPVTLNSVLSEVLAASEQLMGVGDTTLPSISAFWHKRNARMITQQAAGKHATAQVDAGQVARSRASGQQAQTETAAFKKQFGDSKVVDASGDPLIVYHGSGAKFATFDKNKRGATTRAKSAEEGFFFTSSKSLAYDFKKQAEGAAADLDAIRSAVEGLSDSQLESLASDIGSIASEDLDLEGREFFIDSLMDMYQHDTDINTWPEESNGTPKALKNYIPKDILEPGAIHDVYLRIENPHEHVFDEDDDWHDEGAITRAISTAQKNGNDGVILRNMVDVARADEKGNNAIRSDVYIAFEPDQIIQSEDSAGIRFSRSANPASISAAPNGMAAWDSPSASKFDDFVYKMQDKHVDTKRVIEAIRDTGKAISDDLDVYLQETLFHGRAAKRTQDFLNKEVNPLIEYMQSAKVEMSDLEEFLHARHAQEANALIAKRDPNMPDGGSGMTNAEAAKYLNSLNGVRRKQLENAAKFVDKIIGGTRETIVNYGLESQETVDGWTAGFKHYIPLQREDKDGQMGIGQGFSVKGKETKGRTGSTRKVVDILANVMMQRERAIVRGEKNRVAVALLGLAKDNPRPEFWQVDKVPTTRVLDKVTGLVRNQADPMYKSRDNAIVAKVNGQEHAILMNEDDARAMRMAEALKNLDAAQLEGLLGATATATRYFAAVNTQYNPIFGVTNFVRDIQEAMLHLQSTPLAGQQARLFKNTFTAVGAVMKAERDGRKGNNATGKWGVLWEDFQNTGGQTGFRDQFSSSADRGDAIKNALTPGGWADTGLGKLFTAGGVLKVPLEVARKKAAWLFDLLSDYNTAMENGVRLSAYETGINAGMSKEQAAALAKGLTVNFNRKGQVTQQVGALYAFFNASVQGTARLGQSLFDMDAGKPKTLRLSSLGKKIVSGGVMLGASQAVLLAMAGFDDEEPPEFIRERNIIIPTGGKTYISIPMPLGYHVIANLGRIPMEFVLGGGKDGAKYLFNLMDVMADIYNPIGNSGLSMQTIAPTVLDPLAGLAENKDFSGRAIAKESFNRHTPGHALARDTASLPATWLAELVNYATGGTEFTRGELSPTPDQIDYLVGQLTGGVGRETTKFVKSIQATATGDDLPWHNIPLAGRFIGDADSDGAKQSAFYNNMDKVRKHAEEVKGLRAAGRTSEAIEYANKHPQAKLHLAARAAEKQVKDMRDRKRDLEQAGAPREEIRALEKRMVQRMEQFVELSAASK